MRWQLWAAGSVTLGLSLTGCSGGAGPEQVTVTRTVTHAPATTGATASTSSAEPRAATPTAEEPADTNSPEPTSTGADASGRDDLDLTDGGVSVDDVDFGESRPNNRGDLVKDVGQWAGMISYDQETVVALLRVTEIEMDVECTSQIKQPSENGHFLALTFEVQTAPELAKEAEQGLPASFWISPMDMKVFDEDGNRENDSFGNGSLCLDQGESLPTEIGPGEKVRGTIVLDTAFDKGTVTLPLRGADPASPGAWAWEF